ncbi:formylglycine-generating enzyme family protein [Aulosira sp. FACHB-615]|nr:formylglycine-generating enzyme family protein [Aulosira sp. FACHB-615]
MILEWSEMVAGKGNTLVPGYIFRLDFQPSVIPLKSTELISRYEPEQLVQRFRVASSPMARRLAGLLAASPSISLPVIRLIQNALLPKKCNQVNVAEVLLGGILKPKETPQAGQNPDEVEYDFIDTKIRSLLLELAPVPDTVQVLSKYIENKFGIALDEFIADLNWIQSENKAEVERNRFFALVAAEVLKRKGGLYSEFVQEIERRVGPVGLSPSIKFEGFPPFHPFEFQVATVTIEDVLSPILQPFEFEIAIIEQKESGLLKRKEGLIIKRRQQSQYFIEDLGNDVHLEMVQIPGGKFTMGSPLREKNSTDNERPQHQVTVPEFFIGKYPITQTQWQTVASWLRVNRKLKPDPSNFKGANRPVEFVSWYDAEEFCSRLSQYTGKSYRLPSEAEWEYACRAGTTTPFHFGETITSELANYNAEYTYGTGVKATYRGETTEVGSFGVANNFGLYDMHGNVYEWCLDDWHDNYEGAPINGSPWFNNNGNFYQKQKNAVLRGGAWFLNPQYCRSAFRFNHAREDHKLIIDAVGFRVVCEVDMIS